MADYYGKTRTNYFSVTDEAKFRQIIASCGATDELVLHEEKLDDGNIQYMFYCEGSILGLPDKDDDADYDYDAFCIALQQVLPDGDAILITTIGWEKIRYFVANCDVVTNREFKSIDLQREAVKLAGVLLGNPDYATRMDY